MRIRNLYRGIRLLANLRKEPYLLFYRLIGCYPDRIELYQMALSHKSIGARNGDGMAINNERLEFLGDAVLSAVVADVVYQHFQEKEEGFLTDIRSKIVQRESLNHMAIELGLPKLMHTSLSKQGVMHVENLFGNALEALIGAIYLDRGYRQSKRFIEKKLIASFANINSLVDKEFNFKSHLIEWGQAQKIEVNYEVIETYHGNGHELIFQSQAMVGGLVAGLGVGRSKKESQQHAAKMALKKLQEDKSFRKEVLLKKASVYLE